MRLFIAVELTEEIRAALVALQTMLRRTRGEVSWTKPDNHHLTLKFLGEVAAQLVPAITQACQEAVSEIHPFTVSLRDTGAFPNLKQPRVLWVGLERGLAELRELHVRLDEHLAPLGFDKDDRVFKPHLTLGRVKSMKNSSALISQLTAEGFPALSFTVSEIVLMQSQLHPAGSIYTPLAKIALPQ
jgi:2'-5' RNA ligase